MKNLIFFSLILLSFGVFAQGETLDSIFAKSPDLTDKQAKEAENFNHVGKKQSVLDEACKKDPRLSGCDVNKASSDGVLIKGALGGAVEQHIGKLYAVLFGGLDLLSGKGGPTVKVKEAGKGNEKNLPGADELNKKNQKVVDANKSGDKKTKDEGITAKSDYCAYAALGYEAAATILQTVLQKKGTTDAALAEDTQMQALIALKETHKARRTTSTIQASVYGATALCYITRATGALDKNKVVLDWKYWAKMSAASGLATLYTMKAHKHNRAMQAVQNVIDAMPKAGACNPWTDTACFCAEASSKTLFATQYEEVCVLNKGNINTPKIALGCVATNANQEPTYDKECNCKKTNSCVKANVTGYNPKFSFGSNLMAQSNQGFDMISSGNFDQGQFDQYAMQSGVMAAKVKDVFTTKVPAVNLTDEQKKEAGELKDIVPPALAALAAATPSYDPPGSISNDGTSSALASLPADIQKKVDDVSKAVKYGSKGGGFDSTAAAPEEGFKMPNFGAQETQQSGAEVLSFAEQAVNNADVNKTPDKPIFDIISNRYRRSGWNKLQAEEEKK